MKDAYDLGVNLMLRRIAQANSGLTCLVCTLFSLLNPLSISNHAPLDELLLLTNLIHLLEDTQACI